MCYNTVMEKKTPKRVHIGKETLFTRNKTKKPFVLDVLFLSLKLLLVAVLIVGMAGAGLVYGVFKVYIDTTPMFDVAQLTKSDRTSYLFDINGQEIMPVSSIEYRDWVDLEEIPEMLRNAFISVEDVRFYKHSGVDFKRLFSATLEILGNSNSSGGSTITQQLIKNKVLGAERTYKRKIQEAFLALQCENVMEKDDILEAYLNDIYLGGSNYGVKTAAKDFFGKELSELTIRECAMIAGLTQNPYRYNPRLNFYWERYGRASDAYEKYTVARIPRCTTMRISSNTAWMTSSRTGFKKTACRTPRKTALRTKTSCVPADTASIRRSIRLCRKPYRPPFPHGSPIRTLRI